MLTLVRVIGEGSPPLRPQPLPVIHNHGPLNNILSLSPEKYICIGGSGSRFHSLPMNLPWAHSNVLLRKYLVIS